MQAAQAPPVARWNARASGRGQTLRRPTRCSHACHRRLHDDIPHAGPSLAGCQLASRPTRWPSRSRRQDVAAVAVAVAGRSSSRAVSGRSSRPTTERTGNLVCLRRPSPQRPLFSRSTPAKHASRKNTPVGKTRPAGPGKSRVLNPTLPEHTCWMPVTIASANRCHAVPNWHRGGERPWGAGSVIDA